MKSDDIIKELSHKYEMRKAAASFLEMLEEDTLGHRVPDDQSGHVIWRCLKKEIYNLLCTNSMKYKKERAMLSGTSVPAVALLSGFLNSKFGITIGTAAALAAIALTVPLKISVNAWCSTSKNNKDFSITSEELVEIKKLAGGD